MILNGCRLSSQFVAVFSVLIAFSRSRFVDIAPRMRKRIVITSSSIMASSVLSHLNFSCFILPSILQVASHQKASYHCQFVTVSLHSDCLLSTSMRTEFALTYHKNHLRCTYGLLWALQILQEQLLGFVKCLTPTTIPSFRSALSKMRSKSSSSPFSR